MANGCLKLSKIYTIVFLFTVLGNTAPVQGTYSQRPNIEEVQTQVHSDLDPGWPDLKRAHFAFVAQLLVMYPNTEIYFLARDSELLYDTAKLVASKTQQPRLHLINVSRSNMYSNDLLSYLGQEKLDAANLHNEKKIVFVDTGFSGTISKAISDRFPEELKSKLKTHLIVSANPEHPSSRVFLSEINKAANRRPPQNLHSTILSYEFMPRATERSDHFEYVDGSWHSMNGSVRQADGVVSPRIALKYMEDLKASWETKEMKAFYSYRRRLYASLFKTLKNTRIPKQTVVDRINDIMSKHPAAESFVRDFLDKGLRSQFKTQISIEDLKLASVGEYSKNTKFKVIKEHPEWKEILSNPEVEFPKLFHSQNYQVIGSILDILQDDEIDKIVAQELSQGELDSKKRALLEALLMGNDGNRRKEILTEHTLGKIDLTNHTDIVEKAIGTFEEKPLFLLVAQIPLSLKAQLIRAIEKSKYVTLKEETLNNLLPAHRDIVKLLFEKTENFGTILKNIFATPSGVYHTDLIRELFSVVRRGDTPWFSPETDMVASLLKESHEGLNSAQLRQLISTVLELTSDKTWTVLNLSQTFEFFIKRHSALTEIDKRFLIEAHSKPDLNTRKDFLSNRGSQCETFYLR